MGHSPSLFHNFGVHPFLDEPGIPRSPAHRPSKRLEAKDMLRSVLLTATVAVLLSATTAMADKKSDCQKGVAMIKAELKKKHPPPVLDTLRKALSDAETEVIEEDWSECMDHIKTARAAISK
jgi:hypothetical protein